MDSPNFSQLSTGQQIQNPMLQAILIMIVIVVFGWFVLGPKYTKTTATQARLTEVEDQRANLESDQEELNRLISKLEDSEQEVDLLDEAVPLTGRPTKIAVLLDSYAQSSGVLLTQLNISGPDDFISSGNKSELSNPYQANRELATIEVSATIIGTIEQFKNFLTLLEQSGRLIDVDSMTVTSSDTEDTFSLRMKTYAYELAEAPVAPEGEAQ